jgi:hypothetical protein
MSKIEVNQISSQCGSTLTIGQSGDTVTLACGATQTGFGRTGTVDWCTTAKTAPFTGVSGKGYFVNTTCGAVTVTLPATPSAGDIISIADYTNTFQTNAVTICRNSSKIGGICANASLSTQGQSITLVYVDATEGWKNVQDSTSNVTGNVYITATGGTITTSGDYKIHTFTADGCFSVSSAPTPANNNVDYLVVAGGGGGGVSSPGGNNGNGGGGGGGFRESHTGPVSGCYTTSPLANGVSLPVSIQTYPITVGAGGAGAAPPAPTGSAGTTGSNSIFSTITSAGGGGAGPGAAPRCGLSGGSGGGAGGGCASSVCGGAGNTPPTSPPQGQSGGTGGGTSPDVSGGGGGGATQAGTNGTPGSTHGPGGNGATTSISASPTSYSGGGGAGSGNPCSAAAGTGGTGGGGAGGSSGSNGTSGTTNTGGGGGGAAGNPLPASTAGTGGSGIVIIRYKFQ